MPRASDTPEGQSQEPPRSFRDDAGAGSSGTDAAHEPLTYEITFRADAAFVEKLRRLQAVLSDDPNPSLAPILDRAIELALDKFDPERRHARREARRTRRDTKHGDTKDEREHGTDRHGAPPPSVSGSDTHGRTEECKTSAALRSRRKTSRRRTRTRRKIPQRVRDLVFARDGHRCTHLGPDGRCPAIRALEIEHICPHAQGGTDDIDNLRTLCRAHNQRAAEIAFGVPFIRRRRFEGSSVSAEKPPIPGRGQRRRPRGRELFEAVRA